jgi:DNA-binding transcriptional LysR family regulator
MDWDKLRVFHAAVNGGSFTKAGASLNLSQSAVSRKITSLEHDLQISLFHRHARGLKLTEQGEVLHSTVREVIARISMAEAQLLDSRDSPSGLLKLSACAAFGAFWLAPRLREFHELFPDITLSVTLDGGYADLPMREADVAIRTSLPDKATVICRRLFTSRAYAFAAPEYLRRNGIPSRTEELDQHTLAVESHGGRSPTESSAWLLRLGASPESPRRPAMTFDSLHGLYGAVSGGLGIGALPHFIRAEAAGLVRVLPDCASMRIDGYLTYPAELRHSKRIAIFRDFLLAKVAEAGLKSDPEDRLLTRSDREPATRSSKVPANELFCPAG